jgi:hypothetical protein
MPTKGHTDVPALSSEESTTWLDTSALDLAANYPDDITYALAMNWADDLIAGATTSPGFPNSTTPELATLPAGTATLDANADILSNSGAMLDGAIAASGATPAQVRLAVGESGLSVTGAGVKVGVLSDSFNDLGAAAADEADGALPTSVTVLQDLSSGGTDEGRALLQVVHDIAQGASLYFTTAFQSELSFANGILALAAAGCKVICDDVSYFDEPFFQNGIIAQAIETVEKEGVVYLTSAGNNASNAYQSSWTPIANATYDHVKLRDTESFAGSPVQTITVSSSGYSVPLLLEWNQPYGATTSNLEMLVFSGGQFIGKATNTSSGNSKNPWIEYNLPGAGTYQIAIENLSGPNPGLIKEIAESNGLSVSIGGANAGSVYGHAMTPGAITVGAVSAANTPAFAVNPPQSEPFSSSGAGTELLFSDNGTPLSTPLQLNPVAISGVDDVSTTLPGGLSDFYGTSASVASIAGVAALMLQANPNLSPTQISQLLAQSRSEERRVGKECKCQCRSRWSPYH